MIMQAKMGRRIQISASFCINNSAQASRSRPAYIFRKCDMTAQ
jgi:hypothetical protein